MVTTTAQILDKGSLNMTITASNIHMLRPTGNLYLRTKSNGKDQVSSWVLISSENRRDDSTPTTMRKTKATHETNVASID